MTKAKEDFDLLVEMVLAQGGTKDMRPVIEKELLHYDILFALDEAKLLDRLVFEITWIVNTVIRHICWRGGAYRSS